MRPNQRDIATAFSIGRFESCFDHLSEDVVWEVIGESLLRGKDAVINGCRRTAEYFASVTTDFTVDEVIVADNKVVIRGTGEFLRDGKRVNLIRACDCYDFTAGGKLHRIMSYCIPEKK